MKKEGLKVEEWKKEKNMYQNSDYSGINYQHFQEEEPKNNNDEFGFKFESNFQKKNIHQKSPEKKLKEVKKIDRERSISENFIPINQLKLEYISPYIKQFQMSSTLNSPHLSFASKNLKRQVNSQYYVINKISPDSQSSKFSQLSQPFQNHLNQQI